MAQATTVIANGAGAAVRAAINSALEAMTTKQSGSSAPSPTYPFMDWADTANDLLKLRNAANSAWITKGSLSADYWGINNSYGFSLINGYIEASVSANALTVAVKTLAGSDPSSSDPVYVLTRDATAASGLPTRLAITAATSLTVSSGSTLGAPGSSTPFALWLVGFNDTGTFRLGIINCTTLSSGVLTQYPLAGFGIASSTAEGGAGAADSAQTFYTGTAVASKPYAVLCRLTFETGLATAGTWASAPTRVDMFRAGMPLPGQIVQRQGNETGAAATGPTAIPNDDTIPQIGEGTQFMSQAITPTSAANLLVVQHLGEYSSGAGNSVVTAALFQDSVANALKAGFYSSDVAGQNFNKMNAQIALRHTMVAAVTASTTFKVRAGTASTITLTFNGYSGSRLFGGVANSYLTVEEIAA